MSVTRRGFNRVLGGATSSIILALDMPNAEAQQAAVVPLQPLAAQIRRLIAALDSIGEPLNPADCMELERAFSQTDEPTAVQSIQQVLDRYVLMTVDINPESRVSVSRGSARAELDEQGWRTFLVKVINEAGDTAALKITSPQGRATGRVSQQSITGVHDFTNGAVDVVEARDRWAAVNPWDKPPLQPALSGLAIEYRILQIYSRDRGQRDLVLDADAGYGQQDLGFRSSLGILFNCLPSTELPLRIPDVDGTAVTASILITDKLGRVYPVQSKRALPDLWFERQIYRASGESVRLSRGTYEIEYGRGPEYLRKKTTITIGGDEALKPLTLALERWVDPKQFGYYAGDTHIHAAGCAHYESPYEGVTPEVMFRQVRGEALSVGDVLTWAPGFDYQRQFFSGHVHHAGAHEVPESKPAAAGSQLLRYDIEVSGFPSSHCGHLVLLRLRDQNYPGTKTIDDWPSWNLPVLKWAKGQGAVVGYAHSAGGLTTDHTELPNYAMPRFDSSGANEYIVDVTHPNCVDFISGCDMWPFAELNIWYHTLNCGFAVAFAGETDFPCITDERVGGGRSYVKLSAPPAGDRGYDAWVMGLRAGNGYFGDGRSHILNFRVEGAASTGAFQETLLDQLLVQPGKVSIKAQICARLEPEITEASERIRLASKYDRPYWHLERARRLGTRTVPVELVVNGMAVDSSDLEADGKVRDVQFETTIAKSSWIALRILPSSHTNPIRVALKRAPVRASRKSAEWCRKAVDVCWEAKSQRIRPAEMEGARAAFEHARAAYDRIVAESAD
jgi:hypothetical protein